MALNYYCVDAGSAYCPCHLAQIDSCLICSHLQGEKTCDCMWQGLCIYHEYIWNGRKVQNPRENRLVKIVEKKMLGENIWVIKVAMASKELLSEYDQPGVFAFVRGSETLQYYDVPLCVMEVNKEDLTLTFAVSSVGPKTKALLAENKEVLVRGPYFNGLFGLKHIKSSFSRNWLLIGGGIGQVSLVPVAKNLLRGDNKITALLDAGHLKGNFIIRNLKNMDISYKEINTNGTQGQKAIKTLLKKESIDYIYSAGSDVQHRMIDKLIKESGADISLIISNNHQLCCGEGVCGSCELEVQGKPIHLCKIQLDSKKVLGV